MDRILIHKLPLSEFAKVSSSSARNEVPQGDAVALSGAPETSSCAMILWTAVLA